MRAAPAQALAVLGDGCELRYAAAIAGLGMADAIGLAAGLVRLEVLACDDPPHFIHPVVRDAVEGSLASNARDALHRCAARVLYADRAPPGQIAAHLVCVLPAGDGWVLTRLREAARAAMQSGAPGPQPACWAGPAEPPPGSSESTFFVRPLKRRRALGARRRACCWRRLFALRPIRVSAPNRA